MYAIEGLFKCNSIRDIFNGLRLLVVASIFQDCLNVDDIVMQVKIIQK